MLHRLSEQEHYEMAYKPQPVDSSYDQNDKALQIKLLILQFVVNAGAGAGLIALMLKAAGH